MPPTVILGPENTLQNTDNNIRGMDANVYDLEPSVSPLVSLSDAMGSGSSDNPKFEWLEDERMPRLTTLTASASANATSFTVAADIFRVGDVVRFSGTAFGLLVTATGANNIQGSLIGTTGATLAVSSEVFLVANANQEGASLRALKMTQLVTQFNYDEIFRTPFGVTTTELGTNHYGGDERARLRKNFGIEHARQIENSAFFGIRNIGTIGATAGLGIAGTARTAGGLLYYIASNVSNVTATGANNLTEYAWQTFLKQGFRYGSEVKTLFASPTVVANIEGFARGNLRVVDSAGERYGIMMKRYVSGQGQVDIIMHRDWNDSPVYGGYAFLVDMEAVKLRPLRNVGGTRLLPNRQAPDYDGVKDEYRSETGLQVIHERRHALLTGVL